MHASEVLGKALIRISESSVRESKTTSELLTTSENVLGDRGSSLLDFKAKMSKQSAAGRFT